MYRDPLLPPGGEPIHRKTRTNYLNRAATFYLQQILKLVDAETQLGHAGFEQLPEAILLHQTHKHTERLFLWHLEDGERENELLYYKPWP